MTLGQFILRLSLFIMCHLVWTTTMFMGMKGLPQPQLVMPGHFITSFQNDGNLEKDLSSESYFTLLEKDIHTLVRMALAWWPRVAAIQHQAVPVPASHSSSRWAWKEWSPDSLLLLWAQLLSTSWPLGKKAAQIQKSDCLQLCTSWEIKLGQ